MDERTFDRLARLLGEASDRRAGLKAALAAVLGGSAASPALAGDAARTRTRQHADGTGAGHPNASKRGKKRKTCKPACGAGFDCVRRQCVCATGLACGGACCRTGQVCQAGECVAAPDPVACIPAGEPCKNAARPCCDGRVCGSGQGGATDVACYSPKTGPCAATDDCVYGMSCRNGRCAPPPPVEQLGGACDAAAQQLCAVPGAVCTDYTGADAPAGTHCTLPLGKVCTGDPDCTCYHCWYPSPTAQGAGRGHDGRASTNTKACCHPAGQACAAEKDCCFGLECVGGVCGGTMCVPDGGACVDGACCDGLTCQDSVCSGGVPCTIDRADYADDATAGAALKALVEAANDGDVIRVGGPGVFKPVPGAGQRAALVIANNIRLQACSLSARPTIDGGATVTKTAGGGEPSATDNAKDLTWTGGTRIVLLEAGKTVTIDGIHLTNGNANGSSAADPVPTSFFSPSGGAVLALDGAALTLKNLDVSRSKSSSSNAISTFFLFTSGGCIAAHSSQSADTTRSQSLKLQDVNVTQCLATGFGGAISAKQVPVEITGSSAAKARVSYSAARLDGAGIHYESNFNFANGAPTTTLALRHVKVDHNIPSATVGTYGGGLNAKDTEDGGCGCGGNATATFDHVEISGNTATAEAAGIRVQFGGVSGTGATFTDSTITGNEMLYPQPQEPMGRGGGLYNAGKLVLGSNVSISGNKGKFGSGVYNERPTADVTCTGTPVSGNLNNGSACSGVSSNTPCADCFGGTGGASPDTSLKMPDGCCATSTCTTTVCGDECCASSSAVCVQVNFRDVCPTS